MSAISITDEIANLMTLFTNLSTGNLPDNYRERLAEDIGEYIGDSISIISLDYGGLRQFEKMRTYFQKKGITTKYLGYLLPGVELHGGLRPIIDIRIRLKKYTHNLILIDDVTDVGSTTALSGINALVDARREGKIEFDRLYFIPMVSRSSIANVAGFSWEELWGIRRYLAEAQSNPQSNPKARRLYTKFEKNGDLYLLADSAVNHQDDLEIVNRLNEIVGSERDLDQPEMDTVRMLV